MKFLLMLATAALLATPAAAVEAPNPFSQRLQRLPELQRRAALRRAVLDSGLYCKRVTVSGRQGRYRNLVMWTARCEPPRLDYAVYIGPDGSVQARKCSEASRLKLPPCRLPK